jgi:hypothetical protein
MAERARVRRAALFLSLAGTVAAAAWVGGRDEPADEFALAHAGVEPQPVARPASAPPAAATTATLRSAGEPAASGTELDLSRLHREARAGEGASEDAFARHTWFVPPPPPKPAPPPKPVAPPLPFQFMGRATDGAKEIVFLTSKQDRNYAVSVGDTIENSYRVDAITERQMRLTYLPLGQQQTLLLSERD